jgi:hypothetical protein
MFEPWNVDTSELRYHLALLFHLSQTRFHQIYLLSGTWMAGTQVVSNNKIDTS